MTDHTKALADALEHIAKASTTDPVARRIAVNALAAYSAAQQAEQVGFNGLTKAETYATASVAGLTQSLTVAHSLEKQAARAWLALDESLIDEYLEDYETRGEDDAGRDACHVPSEAERFVIKDAMLGLLQEAWDRAATPSHLPAQGVADERKAFYGAFPGPGMKGPIDDARWAGFQAGAKWARAALAQAPAAEERR